MNRLLVTFSCWLAKTTAVIGIGVASAQPFPYTAYIANDQAYVRSGPGQRYYPTDQLAQGFAVEVYRHDGAEWCAVRPPRGSFSWVASHQVRTKDDGIVEVIDDNVVARVGSTIAPNRSAVQVLLPKGERLELVPTAQDDRRWVRIAAPAGEFRWIAASDISRHPPLESSPLPQGTNSKWSRLSQHDETSSHQETTGFDHLNVATDDTQSGSQFRVPNQAPKPLGEQPLPTSAVDVISGSPADLLLAQFQAQAKRVASPKLLSDESATNDFANSQPRIRFEGLASPTLATVGSVEELEIRLSQAVVKTPEQWELTPLEAAANTLLANTKTPPVRAQLREVLDRITRFQEVQKRYTNPNVQAVQQDPFDATEPLESTAPSDKGLTGLSSTVRDRARKDLASNSQSSSENSQNASRTKPRFDAAGVLKPVVSKREQAPKYALVDEQGKVVSFVTPTPDLNLSPYVGRRIGVHGTRGFMPEFRRAHVTAGRATPLERTLRR